MTEPTTTTTHPDSFGRHWVYVTQGDVLSHRRGHLGLGVILCIAWLIIVGGVEAWSALISSNGFFLYGAALFVSGVGMIFRSKIAYLGGLFLPLNYLLRVAFGTSFYYDLPLLAPGLSVVMVCGMAFGVSFYLFEGDRPNFIYRLRYRSYKAEQGAE